MNDQKMIDYRLQQLITAEEFIDLLQRSTLARRRPVDDRDCIEGMLRHGNLCITAWDGNLLVGIARSVTDFHYACYLSDLAVDLGYQRAGIGKALLHRTREALGPHCWLTLISAPDALDYYHSLGFEENTHCRELPPLAPG
jgi:GNAT superfamily N-acetyltransferase